MMSTRATGAAHVESATMNHSHTYETLIDLPAPLRDAVKDLLFRLADDKLIMGHRDSEWTGLGPILEADIALSSMAQDKMGHAHWYYTLLHELGEAPPDHIAFGRSPQTFRSCSLVSLPRGDWAYTIIRQYLFDAADDVRLHALAASSIKPLADFVRKIRGESKYHLMHGTTWVDRLANGTAESRQRLQTALDTLWPHALGLFEPTAAEPVLIREGVCPSEKSLQLAWEDAVTPHLAQAGLTIPANAKPIYGGRTGQQSAELADLLDAMTAVYRLDPTANW